MLVGKAVYGRGRAGRGIDGRGNDDREKDVVPDAKTIRPRRSPSLRKKFVLWSNYYKNPFVFVGSTNKILSNISKILHPQVVIAQWLAQWLATGEVRGSNSGEGDNLFISD